MSFFEDYAKGARLIDRQAAQAALESLTKQHPLISIDRDSVLVLTRERLRDFVSEYLDTDRITYAVPFPVCHDFAEIAFGQFLMGAYSEGFKAAPAMFQTSITMAQGWHKLLAFLVLDDAGNLALDFLQCQGGAWVTEADLNVVSVDEEES